MCTCSNYIIIWFFALLFAIIGLPIWMCGCDEKFGGPCIRYTTHQAKIISNTCYLTHKNIGHSYGDDTIGNNCNVYVEYNNKEIATTCKIYRSDDDNCNGLVTSTSQTNKCNKLNHRDYKIGNYTNIYVDKYERCYSNHYVKRLSLIGFIFLIFSTFLLTIGILVFTIKKIKDVYNNICNKEYCNLNTINSNTTNSNTTNFNIDFDF